MSAQGQYQINGLDLWEEYSVLLEKGSTADLLAMPNPKERITHSWEDEHGEEVLFPLTRFKPREATLKCAIVCLSMHEFWQAYQRFFEAVTAGEFELYVNEFRSAYSLYTVEFGKPERFTRLLTGGKIAVKFNLKVKETVPIMFVKKMVVTDGIFEYVVTNNQYLSV